jgi:hypothetical protein
MSRYETTPYGEGVEDGIAARVHDAAWMLARQLQFGEFEAEDAASPVHVSVRGESHLVDRWRARGETEMRPYRRRHEPLERLVEQEPVRGPDPRLRLEGGLRLRRLLERAGLGGALYERFVAACPFPPARVPGTPLPGEREEPSPAGAKEEPPPIAPAADGLAAAMRRHAPDGALLAPLLARLAGGATGAPSPASELGLSADQVGPVAAVAADWLAWWQARAPAAAPQAPADPAGWDEHRLEQSFELASSTLPGLSLVASEYGGGRLDWWAFDAVGAANPAPGTGHPISATAVPAPARFGGMPATRFWEMEDAQFDPGGIDAAPNDLGRLLLVSFATVYGNDWFTLPLKLPAGSLTRFHKFTVTDVFGRKHELPDAILDEDDFNLFGTTDATPPDAPAPITPAGAVPPPPAERPTVPWFFLAPTLVGGIESQPAESVLLLRDEMANLAWAVEALVVDDAGGAVDRFAAQPERPVPPPRDPSAPPRWRVQTEVPEHWFPLAPEQLRDGESVRLRLVPLARPSNGGPPSELLPLGALLARIWRTQGEGLWLYEEEVPRAGLAVVRTHQQARWHDGSMHTWTGRRKRSGGGEGSSGLRFDVLEP